MLPQGPPDRPETFPVPPPLARGRRLQALPGHPVKRAWPGPGKRLCPARPPKLQILHALVSKREKGVDNPGLPSQKHAT